MGKAGKGGTKRQFKRKVRSRCSGSDDSDEDFVLEDEEIASEEEEDDDVVNSLDGYSSEESFQGSVEGGSNEEEVFRKTSRSKRGRGSDKNAGGKISRKRKTVSCQENGQDEDEDGDGDEDYVVDDDDEGVDVDEEDARGRISRKRKTILCEENDQDEDEDYVVDDDDEDVDEEYLDEDDDEEEFTPEEEDDLVDEEEDFLEEKNSNVKVGMRNLQKRSSAKGKRRRKKSRVSKKPSMLRRRLRKKQEFDLNDEDDADLLDIIPVCKEKSRSNKISQPRKRRRYVVDSDSDFVCSRSSDFEYTISEEEREQVKEASKLFGDLKACLRNSSSTRRIQDNCDVSQRKHNVRKKGKEKAKEVETEVGKQVCGICLSEEDKRRSRGTLNCCSHYFCFVCIMEWSKVESRCPLCKQRFQTITKHGRSTIGVDLRNMVIEVPTRDQVYQPTEEEIRSFVDPYESVICTECREGGDDGLMLLCDICDSPAHTYCVGLGRQVPEGNWYCDGCRPVALGSSSTPAHDSSYDHGTANNSSYRAPPLTNLGESSGPMIEPSPLLAFPQVIGFMPSPRYNAADGTTASPVSGSGAATLSVRRQIHRHIQNIISNRSVYMPGRPDVISATSLHNELINSRVEHNREAATQNSSTQEFGMLPNFWMGERQLAQNLSFPVTRDNGLISSRQSQFGSQVIQDPTMATTDRPENLTLWPAPSGANSIPVNEHVCRYDSRSGVGLDCNLPVYGPGEESQFYALKEQLQSMVKRHLTNLSQDIHLGTDTFKDIARSSTHTILAACGRDHRRSEVQMVPLPAICTHIGETSMMKDLCSSCFESFVRDVVKRILDTRLPQWLSLGL